MTAETELTPQDQILLYRGIGGRHDRSSIGAWWSTNPYYGLRYANGGEGDMFVATIDPKTLKEQATDVSLDDGYENYLLSPEGLVDARKATPDEIGRLQAATTIIDAGGDMPGGALIRWPENAVEIGRAIFLAPQVGNVALSGNQE